MLRYEEVTHGGLMAYSPAKNPDYQEAEMAYERLDEALRQLKTDREREEAAESDGMKVGVSKLLVFLFYYLYDVIIPNIISSICEIIKQWSKK